MQTNHVGLSRVERSENKFENVNFPIMILHAIYDHEAILGDFIFFSPSFHVCMDVPCD